MQSYEIKDCVADGDRLSIEVLWTGTLALAFGSLSGASQMRSAMFFPLQALSLEHASEARRAGSWHDNLTCVILPLNKFDAKATAEPTSHRPPKLICPCRLKREFPAKSVSP